MSSSDSSSQEFSFALRLACWGGGIVLAIAYAVLIPMKWQGMLPREMTWARTILGPPLAASIIPAYILAAIRCPNRIDFCCSIVTIGVVVVVLIFALIERLVGQP